MSLDQNFETNKNPKNIPVEQNEWLEAQIETLRRGLRKGQESLADWQGGQIAVSAVPGAGKSHSLSVAAAIAIARNQLHSRKQLVIVTYTRSAAANIKSKIRDRLKDLMLPPGGFVVQTLHGLALQIANSHKELSGLNLDQMTIVTPTPRHRVIRSAVDKWISQNSDRYNILLEGLQFDGEETEKLRRQSVLRTEILPSLAHIAVREAKSSGLLPDELLELSQQARDHYQILAIAAGLYQQYQEFMRSRDFIDYDDMILAALRVLANKSMRSLWQNQVFGVFEDEAQDSSPLQEKLISILAGNSQDTHNEPNLVRVGDPNQAINSTFTPADPIYFNWFCDDCEGQGNLTTMNQAGRSSKIIIDAANFVLDWVNLVNSDQLSVNSEKSRVKSQESKVGKFLETSVKDSEVIEQPFRKQEIILVDPNDPQPDANPQPEGQGLEIYIPDDIYHTVELIGKRAIALFKANPEHNAAILVREHRQAKFVAEQLAHLPKEHQIRLYEVGESDRNSQIPEEILKLLQFLDRPHSPDNLKSALEVLERRSLIPAQDLNALATYPEQFLYPTPLNPEQKEPVIAARRYCCNLLRARIELPHYQLIPFLGMTLKYTGSELATVQKLSDKVNLQIVRNSSLKSAIEALEEITSSENFAGVEDETGDRYTRHGQITIITMHKAKGLDWDYVFLPFLHEDVLPGQLWTPVAARFLGHFTLAEVARAQIRTLVHSEILEDGKITEIPLPIKAWEKAEKLKKAEEYRLLYVAMTRAKRLLWIGAANNGPFRWSVFRGDKPTKLQQKKPCPVLPALIRKFPQSPIRI
ncbi:DNA/RNA helicase, superfamily I [Xenococcus sp. PCC 7305]|uniref:ATP-dependent helicase n=1 Tax=Xenococcus sp. PCC 7305 TaxID=102125 RepID=UPI0002ACB3F3|nr:ATP-dependent helicase [Xenococcus sp. PCC 7305]ELS03132.1 DNA/RNA helicase, superfamily I [Xenococcus sp. PCC 7305]